jgi:RecB family exonuclease
LSENQSFDTLAIEQLLKSIDELFDALVKSDVAPEVSLESFRPWLNRAISSILTEPYPDKSNGIIISDYNSLHGAFFDRLFLMGLNDRVFPIAKAESSFWPESLITALASTSLGRRLWSNASETYQLQEEIFAQALSQAKKVVVSYHSANNDLRPALHSPIIESLKSLWPEGAVPHQRTNWPLPPEPQKIRDSGELWLHLALQNPKGPAPKEFLELSGFDSKADEKWRSIGLRRSRINGAQSHLFEHHLAAWLKTLDRDENAAAVVNLTMLTSYANCPRSFWYDQILGLEGPNELIEQWSNADRGVVIHQILEKFLSPLRDDKDADVGASRLRYILWELAHKNSCRAPVGRKPLWEAKVHHLEKIMLDWLSRQDGFKGACIEALEWSFAYMVQTACGPMTIKGRVDRIDRENARVIVRDYKSANKNDAYWKVYDPAKEDQSRPLEQYPMVLYGLAAAKNFKAEPTLLVEFVDPQEKAPIVEITKGDETIFSRIWEQINTGLTAKTDDQQACGYCDYLRLCHRGPYVSQV